MIHSFNQLVQIVFRTFELFLMENWERHLLSSFLSFSFKVCFWVTDLHVMQCNRFQWLQIH